MRPVTMGLILAAVAVATVVGIYMWTRPATGALSTPAGGGASTDSTAALIRGIGTGATEIAASIAAAVAEAERAGATGTQP